MAAEVLATQMSWIVSMDAQLTVTWGLLTAWHHGACSLFLSPASPFTPIDSIWAVMIVWRLGGKIIRTVLCCIVYDSCTQWYAHTCAQFLNLPVDFGFDFVCMCFVRFDILNFFCVSIDHFLSGLLVFVVLVQCLQYEANLAKRLAGKTSLKWPILCWIRLKP